MNVGDPVNIEPNELALFFGLKADEVFNQLVQMAPIHNSILPVWTQYAAMRAEFNAATSASIDLKTGVGQTEFASNGPDAVKFYEANNVAKVLIERAVKDAKEATETLNAMISVLNEKLGTGIGLSAKTVNS